MKKNTIYKEDNRMENNLPLWKYLRDENGNIIYDEFNFRKQIVFCV